MSHDPRTWDVRRVGEWLVEEGLERLQGTFRHQFINGEALLALTLRDMQHIGVPAIVDTTTLIKKIDAVKTRVDDIASGLP